jgi:transposase
MKRDGRKLDHKTLEEIRRMAIERIREGEEPSAVIASYGFCRTTIYKWLRAVKHRGRGLEALRSRKGTGRPRKLSKSQQQKVFRWINGKDPRQYGFDFGLWTRKVVSELVSDKFDTKLSLASVGKLLADVGLTPQKPLMRAYERDPAAIDAWKNGRRSCCLCFRPEGTLATADVMLAQKIALELFEVEALKVANKVPVDRFLDLEQRRS